MKLVHITLYLLLYVWDTYCVYLAPGTTTCVNSLLGWSWATQQSICCSVFETSTLKFEFYGQQFVLTVSLDEPPFEFAMYSVPSSSTKAIRRLQSIHKTGTYCFKCLSFKWHLSLWHQLGCYWNNFVLGRLNETWGVCRNSHPSKKIHTSRFYGVHHSVCCFCKSSFLFCICIMLSS